MQFEYNLDDPRPRFFFRYRSLVGVSRSTAEDIILRNSMFWSSPTQFNDPFDCRPSVVFGESRAERRKFSRTATARAMAGAPRFARRKVRRTLEAEPEHVTRERLLSGFHSWMAETAMCCLSATCTSPLMWAHYADAHRGACFVFEDGPHPFLAFPVVYREERPLVNLLAMDKSGNFAAALLTKSTDWQYEHEYRMIDYRGLPGHKPIPPGSFQAIILGARISDNDESFLRDLNAQRQRPVQIFRASISATDFRVEISDA